MAFSAKKMPFSEGMETAIGGEPKKGRMANPSFYLSYRKYQKVK